jgi:hypothetical protein
VATLETYVRADDTDTHRFADTLTTTRVGVDPTGAPRLEDLDDLAGLDDPAPDGSGTAQLTLHRVETFPAGTRFGTWLRLDRATDLEAAFFTDVLAAFVADGRLDGRLDGRAGIGHGQVHTDLT